MAATREVDRFHERTEFERYVERAGKEFSALAPLLPGQASKVTLEPGESVGRLAHVRGAKLSRHVA